MLNTIIFENSSTNLLKLFNTCNSYRDIIIYPVLDYYEARKYAASSQIDFAIIDLLNNEVKGIELGRILRKTNPDVYLVFIIDEEKVCTEIYKYRADGLLAKNFAVEDLMFYINRAEKMIGKTDCRLSIQTFGCFEVFCGQDTIYFSNSKAKELLALCVDRLGGMVSIDYAIKNLWPDRPINEQTKRLYRKAISSLHSTLDNLTDDIFFESGRGYCKINPNAVTCDYYTYLKDSTKFSNNILDTYMNQYFWASVAR